MSAGAATDRRAAPRRMGATRAPAASAIHECARACAFGQPIAYCAVKENRPLTPTLVALAVPSTAIVPLPLAATEPETNASK